jgi:CheY-like chemotaxis protein
MLTFPCTLLVDDNDDTNFLNGLVLNQAGITQTHTALNGQEALDLLLLHCSTPNSSTCPDLILLDMRMPVMDGFEFLQAYAQQVFAQRPAVVVMLTTSLNPKDVEQMKGLPIAGYLTKPLTEGKVRQLLQEHFGHPVPM